MPTTLKRSIDDAEEPNSKRTRTLTDNGDDSMKQDNDNMEDDDDDEDDDEDNEGGAGLQAPPIETNSSIEVAECGTIARVELHNFMCHKYLKVDFGPKINFVIGHNGSGKSAILTAITVALGAAAHSTNRGKNLGSLIKEGQDSALVIIYLTNRGDSPYRPDVYPDHIRVERRINKDGGSSYRIKNSSNRVVSTKREDLVAICDHMALLVTNPLTMLTQDMARKFLSDSSAHDKYKLFMQGTQLTQLQSDYDEIRESLDTVRTTIKRKKRVLPELQDKAASSQQRFLDSKSMEKAEEKIDELNSELVWAQIILKEKEAKEAEEAYLKYEAQFNESKDDLQEKQGRVHQLTEMIQQKKDEWTHYREQPNPFEEEKQQLENEKRVIDNDLRGLGDDIKQINGQIKSLKAKNSEHQKKLDEETAKLEQSSRVKRDVVLKEIDVLKEKREEREAQVNNLERELNELSSRSNELVQQKQELERQLRQYHNQRQETEKKMVELHSQKKDSLRAFGRNVPEVLRDIKAEKRWKKRPPVGPLGNYVQLNYPQYEDVLEAVLGKSLNAFVVECFDDRRLLFDILRRHQMEFTTIMVSEYNIFDYSTGEPDPKYLTILRALSFKDEWVKRQLIIANNIEQFILMENRAEADEVMYSKPHNVLSCFTASGHNVGARTGMKTDSLAPYRGPRRFEKDPSKQIRIFNEELEEIKKKQVSIQADINLIQSEHRQKAQTVMETKTAIQQAERDIIKLRRAISSKEESLKEEEPADLEYYQEAIKENEQKIEGLKIQFQDLVNQQKAKQAEAHEYKRKLRQIQLKEEEREQGSQEFEIKIKKMESKLREYNTAVENQSNNLRTLKLRTEGLKQEYLTQTKVLREWIEESSEDYPDRIETTRSPKEVEKQLTHYRTLIEEKEKLLGGTMEEIEQEANEALRAWNDAKTSVDYIEKLARSLQKILDQRITRWEKFRGFIALAARAYFRFYLHKRGDNGSLKFNHREQTLEIRVSTGDQFKKGGSRQKDSRSLSGGEKSFSQISLLLSLWQSISSPVICLDEFDVFMDAVNRKQTMKLIMEASNDNSSQYILITPQDASGSMTPGPYVTIHKMRDPERHS